MCKPTNEITNIVRDLVDVRNMIAELEAEAEMLSDKVKEFMGDEVVMVCDDHKVTYKEVVSKRVDTTALKKLLGEDALAPYTKLITSRRFSIN